MQIQKRLTTYSNCEFFPELIVITDGTEQPIPRPKNRTKKNSLFRQNEKTYCKESNHNKSKDEIIHKPSHSTGRRNDYAN